MSRSKLDTKALKRVLGSNPLLSELYKNHLESERIVKNLPKKNFGVYDAAEAIGLSKDKVIEIIKNQNKFSKHYKLLKYINFLQKLEYQSTGIGVLKNMPSDILQKVRLNFVNDILPEEDYNNESYEQFHLNDSVEFTKEHNQVINIFNSIITSGNAEIKADILNFDYSLIDPNNMEEMFENESFIIFCNNSETYDLAKKSYIDTLLSAYNNNKIYIFLEGVEDDVDNINRTEEEKNIAHKEKLQNLFRKKTKPKNNNKPEKNDVKPNIKTQKARSQLKSAQTINEDIEDINPLKLFDKFINNPSATKLELIKYFWKEEWIVRLNNYYEKKGIRFGSKANWVKYFEEVLEDTNNNKKTTKEQSEVINEEVNKISLIENIDFNNVKNCINLKSLVKDLENTNDLKKVEKQLIYTIISLMEKRDISTSVYNILSQIETPFALDKGYKPYQVADTGIFKRGDNKLRITVSFPYNSTLYKKKGYNQYSYRVDFFLNDHDAYDRHINNKSKF